jgi:hypothetical protein
MGAVPTGDLLLADIDGVVLPFGSSRSQHSRKSQEVRDPTGASGPSQVAGGNSDRFDAFV